MRSVLRRLVGLLLALVMIPAFARLPADLPQPTVSDERRFTPLLAYQPGTEPASFGGP